jgi:hypothetical protein
MLPRKKRLNSIGKYGRGLWHEILFYTAGELVTELIPGYTPYADKNGLWARQRTQTARDFIERDWKPHMRGTVTLEKSVTKLVDDLSAPTHRQTPKQ